MDCIKTQINNKWTQYYEDNIEHAKDKRKHYYKDNKQKVLV